MSFPTAMALSAPRLVRQFSQRFEAHGERGEIAGIRGAHVRNRAVRVRQLLSAGLDPGGDTGRSGATVLARQHPLGEAAVHSQRRIAQPAARDRLPLALDRESLDAGLKPVAADARTDLEIHARGLRDADLVAGCNLDDIERGVERLERGNARGEGWREPRIAVVLA